MAFTYKKATDSDLTKAYREKEKQLQETKPSAFVSKEYVPGAAAAMSEEYLNKYLNRGPFKYDLNGDALYQQYKDNATRQGKMAMMDTMGQAAAMTGGYGNSYAQTVGQQVYNNSLAEVNNIIPELWQMAYDKYNDEGSELYAKYGLLADKEATEYGRHQDSENQRYQLWSDEMDQWNTDYDRNNSNLWSSIDLDQQQNSEENSYAYQMEQDAIEQDRWQKEYNLSEAAAYTSTEAAEAVMNLSASQQDKFESALEAGEDEAWNYLALLKTYDVDESVLYELGDIIEKKYGSETVEPIDTTVRDTTIRNGSAPSRGRYANYLF